MYVNFYQSLCSTCSMIWLQTSRFLFLSLIFRVIFMYMWCVLLLQGALLCFAMEKDPSFLTLTYWLDEIREVREREGKRER